MGAEDRSSAPSRALGRRRDLHAVLGEFDFVNGSLDDLARQFVKIRGQVSKLSIELGSSEGGHVLVSKDGFKVDAPTVLAGNLSRYIEKIKGKLEED